MTANSIPPAAPGGNPIPMPASVAHPVAMMPPYVPPASLAPWDVAPINLWGTFDPPPLPLGVLPSVIEQFAMVMGMHMGADPSGLAMAAVTVCAAAIPDKIGVRVKQHDHHWVEHPRLWVALIGSPSTKKSPIMNAAVKPLAKIDDELVREWSRKHAIWSSLSKEDQRATQEPLKKRVMMHDTTIEAAQDILKGSMDGVMLHADELSGWFGSMEKYTSGRGSAADRAFWLQAFNGGPYTVDRVSRGSVRIDNLSFTILGGIQPDAIRKAVVDAVDDGLLQRFFPIVLKPADMGQDAPLPDVQMMFDYVVGRCRQAVAPCGPLLFDAGAQSIRRELEGRHHWLSATEAVTPKLAAHIGKLDGLFARLCVVFHVVENFAASPMPGMITEVTSWRVATFMRTFLLPHAAGFYGAVLGLGDDHDRLKAVAAYILANKLTTIDNRTVQRGDHATMRKIAYRDIQPIFEQLATLGWLLPIDGANPKSPKWKVNGAVHQLFAERAEREQARAAMGRAAQQEIFGRK